MPDINRNDPQLQTKILATLQEGITVIPYLFKYRNKKRALGLTAVITDQD